MTKSVMEQKKQSIDFYSMKQLYQVIVCDFFSKLHLFWKSRALYMVQYYTRTRQKGGFCHEIHFMPKIKNHVAGCQKLKSPS